MPAIIAAVEWAAGSGGRDRMPAGAGGVDNGSGAGHAVEIGSISCCRARPRPFGDFGQILPGSARIVEGLVEPFVELSP